MELPLPKGERVGVRGTQGLLFDKQKTLSPLSRNSSRSLTFLIYGAR